jgi:stage II sporulation protein M
MKRRNSGLRGRVNLMIEDAFSYVDKSRNYIYWIIAIFIISAVFGVIFSSHLTFIDKILKEIIEKTANLSGIELILYIFNNNLLVSFLGLILGVVFGIFSLITCISNGVVLGYVFAKIYAVLGFGEFWRILPHGIFELPAIFISLGLGMKLGAFIFNKNPKKEFVYRMRESIKVFVFVVIPLLILAAIIEGFLIMLVK